MIALTIKSVDNFQIKIYAPIFSILLSEILIDKS